MERCDFSSVITIIRKFISDERTIMDNVTRTEVKIDQVHLMELVFASFVDDESMLDFSFDNGLVCRWVNGQAKISPKIVSFYLKEDNRELLSSDIEYRLFPLMYDSAMAARDIYNLLMQDSTISPEAKDTLTAEYSDRTEEARASFMASVLLFGMERNFVKRDAKTTNLLAEGMLSPVVRDFIFTETVPRPCKHFCGRDQELANLHDLLMEHGKVFLNGIAGIGKSELAKAYAKKYSKEYTNILYITYTGDLAKDIANMDFADDLPGDREQERFRKHNRFLRTLKEDTLFIVDNFNTTVSQDNMLSVVMKYRCRMLFTTRSRFDNYAVMELEEIFDRQSLLLLMGCFYSDAEKYTSILEQIIDTVHRHTLAVELAARLLEIGILEPLSLLNKLKEEKASLDASDKIGITKDGQSRKATYYAHIHTLFSLYQLDKEERDIMRSLIFASNRWLLALVFLQWWLKCRDMNVVNDLVEKGFVQLGVGHTIALHPMIQEVAVIEMNPSVQNCRELLNSLEEICLRHGEEVFYYKKMFQTIENVIKLITNDDTSLYIQFLKNVFPYMEKYQETQGMELVLKELSLLLKDNTVGTISDRALLLDYRASCETKIQKMIKLEKEAISLIAEITPGNALLVSNFYANLGGYYKMNGNLELAKQNMEQAIRITEQYGLTCYHDCIVQIANYAVLLTDMGQPDSGLSVLQKLSHYLRKSESAQNMDYAMIKEAMGYICLTVGDVRNARNHFDQAMAIYEVLFVADPDLFEAKKKGIQTAYAQAGMGLGKNLLKLLV